MKKILALVMASVILATSFPTVFAPNGGSVPTGAFIPPGSGSPPIIKAKWERPDDGDPSHVIPGTQVLPPMTWNGLKTVTYWTVVTDPNGYDNIGKAYVDVYHPDGSFKYQVELLPMFDLCPEQQSEIDAAIAELTDAYNNGLVWFGIDPDTGVEYTLEEVIAEIEQCSAKVFVGRADLDYHQMCGTYLVQAYAFDKENGKSAFLDNPLDYVCVAGVELDFNAIDFEEVMISSDKWVEGDYVWYECLEDEGGEQFCPACKGSIVGKPPCRPPTVRNIGNVPAKIWVWFDDMQFGKTLEEWNVEYDARLDLDSVVYFDPEVWTELPGTLDLCTTDKISFSIHVFKADPNTEHAGTSMIEPRADPTYPYLI